MGEQAVPSNSGAVDGFGIGIDNSSAGVGVTPLFQLNYSVSGSSTPGTRNNVTYQPSSQGTSFNVGPGFRSEKGSKIVSITPSLITLNLAKLQDYLQFSLSQANASTPTKSTKLYGPYGVGQATNIPNVSIGPVNATITVGNANFTVSGEANLTATASVSDSNATCIAEEPHNYTTCSSGFAGKPGKQPDTGRKRLRKHSVAAIGERIQHIGDANNADSPGIRNKQGPDSRVLRQPDQRGGQQLHTAAVRTGNLIA